MTVWVGVGLLERERGGEERGWGGGGQDRDTDRENERKTDRYKDRQRKGVDREMVKDGI